MDIDKIFGGMAKADIYGRGTYMDVGLYEVEMKNIFCKEGRNPKKPGDSFIAEFTVISSTSEKHAPGTSGSWVLKFAWPATFGHVTKLVYALLGWAQTDENLKDPKKREQAELYVRAICGSVAAKAALGAEYEDGMFNGLRLKLETSMDKTEKGGDFTRYTWSPQQVTS